jgi:VanZ family protein
MIAFFKFINKILYLKFIRYFAPIACFSLINYLSFSDFSTIDTNKLNIPFFDKFVHFTMYFTLSYILLATRLMKDKNYNTYAISFSIFYAIFTELMQNYVFTYRSGDIFDLLFNFIGITSGFLLFLKTKTQVN